MTVSRHNRLFLLLLPALGLIFAFALRVHDLGDFNMNWDEGYSNWIVDLPFDEMIETTARDVHPPLYYLTLRGAQTAFGENEFSLRYPSVLLGVLTVAAIFALGRLVGGYRVGLLALVLLALARANIDIAQLMRMHILATLFSTGGLWATVRLFQNPRRRGASVMYVLCVAGALYSFYLAVILPVATNLAFLVVWWRRGFPRDFALSWVGLQVVAAVLFLPWAVYAVGLMHGWNAEQDTSFLFFLQVYFVVLTAGVSTFWSNYIPAVILTLLVLLGGAALISRQREQRDPLILMLASILTPVLVVFLLTLPIHNLGRPLAARYLVLTAGGFTVLAAWTIIVVARRNQLIGLVSGVLIFGIAGVGLWETHETRVRRDLFVSLADTLEAHRHPDDAVLLYNDRAWTVFEAEYDGAWVGVPGEAPVDPAYAEFLLTPLWDASDALWLVEHPLASENDPSRHIVAWLDENATAAQSWTFNENTLTLYARTDTRAESLDALAPDYALPSAPLDAEIGLLDVTQPLYRYPTGDSIQLATLWDESHPDTVTFALENGDAQYTFEVAIESPRQQIGLPVTPDIAGGRYTLALTAPTRLTLGTVNVVSTVPDVDGDEDAITHRLDWRFGEHITLVGYDINTTTLDAGERIIVDLYWRTDALLDERYKVLVYALGDFNPQTETPLWGQHDTEPRDWTFPTNQWRTDVLIQDRKGFDIYAYTPPGDYQIGVVVYGLVDGQRLLIIDADGNPLGDMATMTTVIVE